MRFHIQQEIDIPASTQLYNQICFAIAARYYPPGHRLPSTRQLAMQTGLHRNTISKVYRQLETDGIVEAIAGSGIVTVRAPVCASYVAVPAARLLSISSHAPPVP